jgi:hypothetical protein
MNIGKSDITFIEGVELSKLCDYSFGDQSGQWGNIYTSFMKDANILNLEFVEKIFQIKEKRNYMTLFIDNIRLYKREIKNVKPQDLDYVNSLMSKNDLLELCSNFDDMNFIIFTNLEDTPIDEYIFDKIPKNVLSINAVNAISYGDKVNPIPYGLQRKLNPNDNRIEILKEFINLSHQSPSNLLYINHSENTNTERVGIFNIFEKESWVLIDNGRVQYKDFVSRILQCKFMICPIGNAIDCHRNWEVLYLRRVPVMKRYDYLEYLFKDYPVLFVDDYSEINEDLLIQNDHLFVEAQKMNMSNLNLNEMYGIIVKRNTYNL